MWKFAGAFSESNAIVYGINIFEYSDRWTDYKECVEVVDPLYGQKHLLYKYSIFIDNIEHYFLCGEVSNNIYGFYVWE